MTAFIMIELNYTIITESIRKKSEMGANDNLALILFLYILDLAWLNL